MHDDDDDHIVHDRLTTAPAAKSNGLTRLSDRTLKSQILGLITGDQVNAVQRLARRSLGDAV